MAAGMGIPNPGKRLGPCKGTCQHIDCAESRSIAASICKHCKAPIGYETRFYRMLGDPTGSVYTFVHAFCEEMAVERKDQQ